MQVFIKDAPHKENIYDNISINYIQRNQIVKRFIVKDSYKMTSLLSICTDRLVLIAAMVPNFPAMPLNLLIAPFFCHLLLNSLLLFAFADAQGHPLT